jgi:hypothetical protein
MKRMINPKKTKESSALNRSTPMKSLFSVAAAVSLTALSSLSARADFSSTDTKHFHARTSAVAIDYAKYEWLNPDNQPETTVNHIVVSLADQRLYAFHDQQLFAWSNVSSGRTGHETPTGQFAVSEKDVDHHSSIYDNAAMPFFMRLTDNGVGLHAGFLPGYAASHGCVRLPFGMARDLYQHVDAGTPVEITPDSYTATAAKTAAVAV